MTCSRCVTLEAERDQYAQAILRVNEEALATERDRDRLREALRGCVTAMDQMASCGELLEVERPVLAAARAALEGEP